MLPNNADAHISSLGYLSGRPFSSTTLWDVAGAKAYNYALTVVDIASCFK